MRTIARTSTRIITALKRELTHASVHQGAHDVTGRPIEVAEAWEALSHAGARLRELDRVTGTYEIRVSSSLHYLLRRTAPGVPDRIDVVVDRDPDAFTDVTVFVNGREVSGPTIAVHVVDPGATGPDHEWLESVTEHEDDVPAAVRDLFDETARRYHDGVACDDERCTPDDNTDSTHAHQAAAA
ncbi:hypothetical protein ACFYZ8_33460 [Streptomyces sp. NPDC001668]|uniref:hypothetical protein n=1 Tax=Streptomyces sp. NPDC001668 TaxID=3364598 RepID=UPI0036A564F0